MVNNKLSYIDNDNMTHLLMVYRNMMRGCGNSRVNYLILNKTNYQIENNSRILLDNPNNCFYEDARINIMNNGEYWISFTQYAARERKLISIRCSKINVANLDEDKNVFDIHDISKKRDEKNWLFFSANGKNYVIYNITPLEIYEIDNCAPTTKEECARGIKKISTVTEKNGIIQLFL